MTRVTRETRPLVGLCLHLLIQWWDQHCHATSKLVNLTGEL
jgi:hypothetical protein